MARKSPDAHTHVRAFLSQFHLFNLAHQCHPVGFQQLHQIEHFRNAAPIT